MNMQVTVPLLLIAETLAAFLAAFLAIWLWSRTREASWMFMITAALFYFGLLMLKILSRFGILPFDLSDQVALPLWYGLLKLLPPLLAALAFGVCIRENRRY